VTPPRARGVVFFLEAFPRESSVDEPGSDAVLEAYGCCARPPRSAGARTPHAAEVVVGSALRWVIGSTIIVVLHIV